MARPKKETAEDIEQRPWDVTAKHSSGMQFRGRVTEDQFRQIQAILFGDQLSLPVE